MLILIPVVFSYAIITYQDFRYRAVSWILFPIIALLNLCYTLWYMHTPASVFLTNTGINAGIILSQFLFLKLYFSFREKKIAVIIDRYIGLGDIIFYLLLCLFFSPLAFITFHIGSLLFCLLLYIPLKVNGINRTIPLAGLQSLLMIILLACSELFSVTLSQDDWLLNLLQYV